MHCNIPTVAIHLSIHSAIFTMIEDKSTCSCSPKIHICNRSLQLNCSNCGAVYFLKCHIYLLCCPPTCALISLSHARRSNQSFLKITTVLFHFAEHEVCNSIPASLCCPMLCMATKQVLNPHFP